MSDEPIRDDERPMLERLLQHAREISIERFVAHGGTAGQWEAMLTGDRVSAIVGEIEEAAEELEI